MLVLELARTLAQKKVGTLGPRTADRSAEMSARSSALQKEVRRAVHLARMKALLSARWGWRTAQWSMAKMWAQRLSERLSLVSHSAEN